MERWPHHVVTRLRAQGVRIADPEYIARTAWTTDELSDGVKSARPRGPYKLVTLQIGVNDQYRARSLSEFAVEFEPVLRRAVALSGGKPTRVVVVSIPDWGATPFAKGSDGAAITRSIEEYNEHARTLVEARQARWVDVTTTSRRMQADPALVVSDGLHPSGEMYRQWAELIVPAALSALKA